jgi:hypothetical protein
MKHGRWMIRALAMSALYGCGAPMSLDGGADGVASDAQGGTDAEATDATGMTDATGPNCAAPGMVTTVAPSNAQTATSDFNVTLLACTRTATALACELETPHAYTETIEGSVRRIRANGIPNHDVGPFPNPGNPNVISAQTYVYSVPVTPSGSGGGMGAVFGILRTGVVLDPGTAERWNDQPAWIYEALRYATAPMYFAGPAATDTVRHPTTLGVDCNTAHVQPNGAYHYHGLPAGTLPSSPRLTHLGWAADGHPIFGRWDRSTPDDPASPLAEMRGSYRLRSGTRPAGSAGPGGAYDGTFQADWEYVPGLGDLDACNGRTGLVPIDGREVSTYHYVLTNTYPYIPRCFHSTPDPSFNRAMPPMMGDGGVGPRPDGGMGPMLDGGSSPPMCTPAMPVRCCGDRTCDGPETPANCPADCR